MRGRLVSKTWEWNPVLHAPARYRRACRYEAFVPDPIANAAFDLSAESAGLVSDAEQAILRLNTGVDPALSPLARLLLRTESIASSRIEGLQVGARQLARAESRIDTTGRVSSTAREVIGNIDAMQLAVERASVANPFRVEDIQNIHRELMARSSTPAIAGMIRSDQNWIGGNDYNPCGADFVPPPPEHVEPLLDDLCAAMAEEALPPLVQAAVVHAQFETIHPFADGNGRTGRALVHVVLSRRGLADTYVPPISVILAGERERYVDGLVDFREGRMGEWIDRFASAAARSATLALAYRDAVAELTGGWRAMLAAGPDPRSDAAAWAIIEILPAHPVVTTSVALAATGRARAAVHQAFGQLEACGVLEPTSSSKRNRAWEAVGLLDLLEDLEAGRSPS